MRISKSSLRTAGARPRASSSTAAPPTPSCPEPVWRAIGLQPTRDLDFVLADGTSIARKVSDCRFVFHGIEAPSPVLLGEGEDVALLGTVTLETLGLVLNPLRRTLTPMRMRLATVVRATATARQLVPTAVAR